MKNRDFPFSFDLNDYRVEPPRPVAHGPDDPLPYVHYSNDYWNTARLVYGKEQKCTNGAYSDRLWQWDSKAAERAGQNVKDMRTPRQHEQWLSAYHDKPVVLRYIMAGCNLATGYTYFFYGYDWAD